MRPSPALAAALATAALAAVVFHVAPHPMRDPVPAWALFSFAVSAFRAPPR